MGCIAGCMTCGREVKTRGLEESSGWYWVKGVNGRVGLEKGVCGKEKAERFSEEWRLGG